MVSDPQAALERLVAALEAHLRVAQVTEDPDSPAVVAAEQALQDAFFTYDNALFTAYEVELPLELDADDSDEDEDEEDYEDFDLDDSDEEFEEVDYAKPRSG